MSHKDYHVNFTQFKEQVSLDDVFFLAHLVFLNFVITALETDKFS